MRAIGGVHCDAANGNFIVIDIYIIKVLSNMTVIDYIKLRSDCAKLFKPANWDDNKWNKVFDSIYNTATISSAGNSLIGMIITNQVNEHMIRRIALFMNNYNLIKL